MSSEHEFKILSIDGGGIKGLYTAIVLAKIEEKFNCRVADYFDMLCGTSTGGLLALALSLKIPASDLVAFYKNEGPKIFGSDNLISNSFRTLKQTLFGGKYNDTTLRTAVTGVLGEALMSDANTLLCIPSFNLMRGTPRVFKFPHLEGDVPVAKYGRMVDVALATSAAPTYFPIASIDNDYYIDGGVWANNPTLCGLMEGLEYFIGDKKPLLGPNTGKKFTSYSILSLASIAERADWTTHGLFGFTTRRRRSFIGWRDKLFQTSLDAQSHFANNFAGKLTTSTAVPGRYHRIESPVLSPAHYKIIGLDKASKASLIQLESFGERVGDHYCTRAIESIKPFFSAPKQYLTHK